MSGDEYLAGSGGSPPVGGYRASIRLETTFIYIAAVMRGNLHPYSLTYIAAVMRGDPHPYSLVNQFDEDGELADFVFLLEHSWSAHVFDCLLLLSDFGGDVVEEDGILQMLNGR